MGDRRVSVAGLAGAALAWAALALACGGSSAVDAGGAIDAPATPDDAGYDAGAGGDALPDPDGAIDGGTGLIIDECDGSREFLPIPAVADLVLAAGIYAGDLFAPTEIYALDLDADNLYRVSCSNFAGEACTYAGVHASPDRKKLVAMRGCADTSGDERINFQDDKGLAVLDLENDTVLTVAGYQAVNSPDWSADDEIVFAAKSAGLDTDLFRMSPSGDDVVNLTNSPSTIENDCSWSPDGAQIVFARGAFVSVDPPDGEDAWIAAWDDLYVMDRDGAGATPVVSFAAPPCGFDSEYAEHFCKGLLADPAFVPAGDRIVYAQLLSVAENGGRGRWNIMAADADGLDQDLENLTDHPTAYQDIAHPSPHGIVFHEVDLAVPFYGLVVVDLDGSNRRVVLDNSSWTYFLDAASWLP